MTVAVQSITRVIFKCQNKDCKCVWAHDYYAKQVKKQYSEGTCTRHFFQVEGVEVEMTQHTHAERCPRCASMFPKFDHVNGVHDETHKCDARCMNAKGKDCTCECGGENHGRSFLI